MLEEVERVISRLRKKDVDRLMHSLDQCLLMANEFSETRKPEYYIRMKSTCQAFLETLTELEKKDRTLFYWNSIIASIMDRHLSHEQKLRRKKLLRAGN